MYNTDREDQSAIVTSSLAELLSNEKLPKHDFLDLIHKMASKSVKICSGT
jgi:uncharacterized protein YqgQ